jgi:hypothetical protein
VQDAARLVLVQVKDKRERSLPVRPPGVEKTSRLGSRDPVDSRIKYGLHDGKNGKMKSRTVSWFSHQTKVEWRLHGSQVMSGKMAEATSSSRGLRWFTRKPLGYSAEPQSRGRKPGVAVKPKLA